jgi:hypothetical protein
MALVVKVSKPGYDVEGETEPRNFIFNSNYNHLKTTVSGSFTQTVAIASNETKTISHGLTYRPLAIAYWRDTADNKWLLTNSNPENSASRQSGTGGEVVLYVDTSNLYIKMFANASEKTFEVKYEIFFEGTE